MSASDPSKPAALPAAPEVIEVTPAPPRSPWWAWGRLGARAALALLALSVCFFLLQFFPLVPGLLHTARASPEQRFEVKALGYAFDPDDRTVAGEIVGRAAPAATVEVTVGRQTYRGNADASGQVRVPIRLPEGFASIVITTKSRGDGGSEDRYYLFHSPAADAPVTPPVIDLAVVATNHHRLWIAGRSARRGLSGLMSLESETGQLLGELAPGYDNGVFEALVPWTAAPPARVTARLAQTNLSVNLSLPYPSPSPVLPVAELPLKRTAAIRFEAGVPVVTLEATLPAKHPRYRALAQGYLRPEEFIEALWHWYPQWRPGDVQQRLLREGERGVVRLTGTWFGPVQEVQFGGPSKLDTGQLLLSTNDSITVDFGEVKPVWFDNPLPAELTETVARWQGPLAAVPGNTGIRFGVKLPPGIAAQTPDEELEEEWKSQRKPEPTAETARPTMLDWVATDRHQPNESWLRQTWRNGVVLLPCLAFLWLAWRRPFGRAEVWPPAVAAVTVLGAASLWYLAYTSLYRVTQPWLTQVVLLGLSCTGSTSGSRLDLVLRDSRATAFVLVALAVAGLGPAYFRSVATRWAGNARTASPVDHRAGRLSGLWLTVRVFWGTLWAGVFAVAVAWTTSYSWRQGASGWLKSLLSARMGLDESTADRWFNVLGDLGLGLVVLAVLVVPLLLTLSLRAGLFGLGLLLLTLRGVQLREGPLQDLERATGVFSRLGQTPAWAVVAVATLLAFPFIVQLLGWLLPPEQRRPQRRRLRAQAAGLIGLSLVLPFVPVNWVLVACGGALLTLLVWVLLEGTQAIQPVQQAAAWYVAAPRRAWALGALLALVIAWPIPGQGPALEFSALFRLFQLYCDVFLLLVTGVFLLVLKDFSDRQPGPGVFPEAVLGGAVVLFAFFVVQGARTWAFIPVPFLVGWLVAQYGLILRAEALGPLGPWLGATPDQCKKRIAEALEARKAQSRLEAIEKALNQQLEAAELTAEEYKTKLESYRAGFGGQNAEAPAASDLASVGGLFAVPRGTPWQSGVRFVGVGALLAAVPLVLTLYEYLPVRQIAHPYPGADLLAVLLRSLAGWLLIAFFFGFFYLHIRGRNGLDKGLAMCAAVLAPVGVYTLLNVPSLADLRPFFLWAAQMFAFCTLLGGVADYRALRAYGYRLRDLLVLHRLPWVSVSVSAVAAAVVPGIVALVGGKLGDLVKFFIETVLASGGKAPS